MRKLLILVLLLLSLPAYAQKSEWIDGAYDFSTTERNPLQGKRRTLENQIVI